MNNLKYLSIKNLGCYSSPNYGLMNIATQSTNDYVAFSNYVAFLYMCVLLS